MPVRYIPDNFLSRNSKEADMHVLRTKLLSVVSNSASFQSWAQHRSAYFPDPRSVTMISTLQPHIAIMEYCAYSIDAFQEGVTKNIKV